jgi:hypothetical protein
MTTDCQGTWRHAGSREDGEGGHVERLVCTGCGDEWYVAYGPAFPGGKTVEPPNNTNTDNNQDEGRQT